MNEIEYVLRIVLKARDELAMALRNARKELNDFARDANTHKSKIDAFNTSMEAMEKNVGSLTSKFAEWRAVLQGTSGGTEDAKKSITTLNRELETSVKTTRRAATTVEEYRKQTSAANQEVKALYEAQKRGAVEWDFATLRIRELGKELEKTSLKFKSSSRDAERAFDWSRRAKEIAGKIIAANDEITADAKAEADKRVKITEDEQRRKVNAVQLANDRISQEIFAQIKRQETAEKMREATIRRGNAAALRALEQQLKEEERVHNQRIKALEDAAKEAERIRQRSADAERVAVRQQAAQARIGGGRRVDVADVTELKLVQAELTRLSRAFKDTADQERHFAVEAEKVRRTIRTIERDAGRATSVVSALGKAFSGNSSSVAGFDNQLRGIGMLAAVGFAQQLITVLGGLAGGFVAVSASAAQAGAAVGGIFVAGVGQALPAIGLLTGALMRVSSVMDVVKQAQTAQQAAAVQGAGASRRVADATDAIANAQDTLANSNRALADAQKGLTEARKQAKEDLDDLIRAEQDAALAAAGAALSQKEAQQALIQAQATGDTAGIQRAQLQVLQAQADAEESIANKRRARREAERGQAGGVEGMEGVQQATRAMEDAQRAAEKASRGIETAKRNAAEAAAGTQTAAATLNYLLAQLSPAERKLYTALQNIQQAYKDTYRPITDLIIDSFTRSVEGVQRIMLMPEVISMARKTAGTISDQLNRIFDAFTSDKMIDQFLRIADAGEKNLKPVTDIVIDLGKSLANIAEAAGPALTDLLEFVGDLVEDFLKLTEQKGKMEDFFSTGEKHFEAWAELGLAVIELFAALAGAGGAETGVQLVKDATAAIEGLVTMVEDNEDAVRDFFSDSRDIIHEVVGVVVALAVELGKAFTPERVDNFATLLKDVVIPALGDVIAFLGDMTEKLVEFAETPFGERLLKGLVFFFVLKRVFDGILGVGKLLVGPLVTIGKVFGNIAGKTGLFEKLGTAFTRMAPVLGRIAFFASGFLAIAGGVVFLLDQLGLLDDAWDAVKSGFQAFWDEVKPSIDKLVENFKDLWDAVSDGEGIIGILGDVFKKIGDILRPILKIVIDVGGVILRVFGRALGRIFGGAIDILAGFFKILEGIIRLDFGMIWEGIKTVFTGLFRLFTSMARIFPELFWEALKKLGPLAWEAVKASLRFFGRLIKGIWEIGKDIVSSFARAFHRIVRVIRNAIDDAWEWLKKLPGRFWNLAKDAVSEFWRAYKRVGYYIRKGIEDVWDWLKGLPRRIGNLAKDAAKAFVDAFKNVGSDILDGIASGLKTGASFVDKLVNAFIDLINSALPNKIDIPGPIGSIDLPDNPIPHLAAGGPVPGSGRGDKIAALLEPGEHVLTRQEVAAMGGHGAVYALRRMLGGGGQGSGGRYQAGGRAVPATAGSLTVTFEGGGLDDFASRWREFWAGLVLRARRGSNLIIGEFVEMRTSTSRQMQRMYRNVEGSLTDIQNRFKRRGEIIVDSWSDTWTSLKKIAFDGLNYIGHETNKALKGLGEKHINFGLTEPKKSDGKAGGGWIGSKGHRGQDRGFYPLGAGEAVLNWQHQKYVEPAMNAYYGHGLDSMFNRTRGYHAGGPGQGGFAAGGMVPIKGFPGESIHSSIAGDVQQLIRKYKLFIYDGYAASGHAAGGEHPKGLAIDAGPGPGGSWDLVDQLARWAEPKQNQPRKPFRWVGYTGDPNHGRDNHIHLSWLAGETLGEGIVTEIKKQLVTGPGGALKTIVQAALDKVRKSANGMIEQIFATPVEGGEDIKVGDVGPGAGNIFKFFRSQGFTDAQAAAWVGNFMQESGLDPSVVQPNGEGHGLAQWGGGRFTALQAFAEAHGKPWQDMGTQLAFVMHELRGSESAAYQAIKDASTLEEAVDAIGSQYERFGIAGDRYSPARDAFKKFAGEYAEGGIIPGPEGAPRPILAHAQEWILNPGQVGRLASMLGVNTAALRSMMGFYGGPGGAQGGTEVPGAITPLTEKQVKGIPLRALRDLVTRLREIGTNIDKAAVEIQPVEEWSKFLDRSARVLRRTTARIRRAEGERDIGRGVRGFLDAMDKLMGDEGVFARLRASIERRSARAATRLLRRQFAVADGVVSERLGAGTIARRQLAQARDLRGDLVEERQDITRSLRQVRRQQRQPGLSDAAKTRLQAQENALRLSLDEASQRVADNLQSISDAQQAYLDARIQRQQNAVDKINAKYEAEGAKNEIFLRMATALGNEGWIAQINGAQRDLLTRQADELQARVEQARGAGATDLATQLEAQVSDLRTSIFESIQQELRDTMERINARASRRLGRLDLGSRMLDAIGAVGLGSFATVAGEGFSRGGLFAQRGAALGTQRTELQGLLGAAQNQGNLGLIQDLTDQIAELDVTIQENTRAAFTARVEDVNARAGFGLNVNDLNKQIAELEGAIAGQVDQTRILALLQERGNILSGQRLELEGLLTEAQRAGDQQAVNDLTVALLENKIAILGNTQAVEEATGLTKDPQTFTSSAWSWFREAIFTGMGAVLPQYDMANMGASAMTGINTGAVLYPAAVTSATRVSGDTNITLNEVGRPVDLQEVSSVVTFASKTVQ